MMGYIISTILFAIEGVAGFINPEHGAIQDILNVVK